ncbi:hypothetical protein BB560_000435 [Smittium megazygosporum]|uniref:SEC7 domain-containing protein n=1 Tax=Smittium megazygosporum TaxID=133381 RepID=A0A2T9ZKE1_9FUNG|nr:hypothetical protein BB560_000435 [Smittium megazygosporum]
MSYKKRGSDPSPPLDIPRPQNDPKFSPPNLSDFPAYNVTSPILEHSKTENSSLLTQHSTNSYNVSSITSSDQFIIIPPSHNSKPQPPKNFRRYKGLKSFLKKDSKPFQISNPVHPTHSFSATPASSSPFSNSKPLPKARTTLSSNLYPDLDIVKEQGSDTQTQYSEPIPTLKPRKSFLWDLVKSPLSSKSSSKQKQLIADITTTASSTSSLRKKQSSNHISSSLSQNNPVFEYPLSKKNSNPLQKDYNKYALGLSQTKENIKRLNDKINAKKSSTSSLKNPFSLGLSSHQQQSIFSRSISLKNRPQISHSDSTDTLKPSPRFFSSSKHTQLSLEKYDPNEKLEKTKNSENSLDSTQKNSPMNPPFSSQTKISNPSTPNDDTPSALAKYIFSFYDQQNYPLYNVKFDLPPQEFASFLGGNLPINQKTLSIYISFFDFTNMKLIDCMRLLCSKLPIQGETQVVDRVILALAQRFIECNKDNILCTVDEAHIVAFSILLLNTDLNYAKIGDSSRMIKNKYISNTLSSLKENRKKYLASLNIEFSSQNQNTRSTIIAKSTRTSSFSLPRSNIFSSKSSHKLKTTPPKLPELDLFTSDTPIFKQVPASATIEFSRDSKHHQTLPQPYLTSDKFNSIDSQFLLFSQKYNIDLNYPQNQSSLASNNSDLSSRDPNREVSVNNLVFSTRNNHTSTHYPASTSLEAFLNDRESSSLDFPTIPKKSPSLGSKSIINQSLSQNFDPESEYLSPTDEYASHIKLLESSFANNLLVSKPPIIPQKPAPFEEAKIADMLKKIYSSIKESPLPKPNSSYQPLTAIQGCDPQTSALPRINKKIFSRKSSAQSINSYPRNQKKQDFSLDLQLNDSTFHFGTIINKQFENSSNSNIFSKNSKSGSSYNRQPLQFDKSLSPIVETESNHFHDNKKPTSPIHKQKQQQSQRHQLTSGQFLNTSMQPIINSDTLTISTQRQIDSNTNNTFSLPGVYSLSGLLLKKVHCEKPGKRPLNSFWHTCYLFLADGKLLTYKAEDKDGPIPGLCTLIPPESQLVDSWDLNHSFTQMMPSPNSQPSSRNTIAVTHRRGSVYLFRTFSHEEALKWAFSINFWAALVSKAPFIMGGVDNTDYGWYNDMDFLKPEEKDSVKPKSSDVSSQSSYLTKDLVQKAKQKSSLFLNFKDSNRYPVLSTWESPIDPSQNSNLSEKQQVTSFKKHLDYLESELAKHSASRLTVLNRTDLKSQQQAKATQNWKKKSQYLFKEITKYRTYIDTLEIAITEQDKVSNFKIFEEMDASEFLMNDSVDEDFHSIDNEDFNQLSTRPEVTNL